MRKCKNINYYCSGFLKEKHILLFIEFTLHNKFKV